MTIPFSENASTQPVLPEHCPRFSSRFPIVEDITSKMKQCGLCSVWCLSTAGVTGRWTRWSNLRSQASHPIQSTSVTKRETLYSFSPVSTPARYGSQYAGGDGGMHTKYSNHIDWAVLAKYSRNANIVHPPNEGHGLENKRLPCAVGCTRTHHSMYWECGGIHVASRTDGCYICWLSTLRSVKRGLVTRLGLAESTRRTLSTRYTHRKREKRIPMQLGARGITVVFPNSMILSTSNHFSIN